MDIWQYKYNNGDKYNVYTLYVKKDSSIPVYYEMIGYDSLLGSHFDEYKVRYNVITTDFLSDVFDEPIKGFFFFQILYYCFFCCLKISLRLKQCKTYFKVRSI